MSRSRSYHRPTLHLSAVDWSRGRYVPMILAMPAKDRESARIAYVPLEPVLEDRRNLLRVAESHQVLAPQYEWEEIKTGAGTPPVRVAEGWLSMSHGQADARSVARTAGASRCVISAGIVIHDAERPDDHRAVSSSPEPMLAPQTTDQERNGVVNDVVFPTGIVVLDDAKRSYDIYYGMADARVRGRARGCDWVSSAPSHRRAGTAESAA